VGRIIDWRCFDCIYLLVCQLAAGAHLPDCWLCTATVAVCTRLVLQAYFLGGVAQLLTPTPKISQDEGDPRKSFSFSGIQNTNRAGVPVPVVYGETLVGSVVISAGIDIVQVSA
jgi:predicted phage tail protein